MRSGHFLWTLSMAVILAACGTTSTGPELPATAPVTVIEQEERVDEEGRISITVERMEELAERSTADKGAESLVTAQRVAQVGSPFSFFDVGADDRIAVAAFNQEGTQGSDIWVYAVGRTRITNTNYFNDAPSFSRDGRFLYSVSTRGKFRFDQYDQSAYIWRMPARGGGGITRIGSAVYQYDTPTESPDGRFLLYSAREFYANSPFIWYAQVNGSLPTQLGKGVHPRWLDDSSIIFADQDESTGLYTIWTMDLDGGDLTQIIADPKLDCLYPAPQPGGPLVAYVKQTPDAPATRDIYLFNQENGLSQQLTTNISRDDMPRWSSDGKSLYFRSTRGLAWNIWRIPAGVF